VVGQSLAVRDGSLTIIGVAAPALRIGSMEPDAYTPLQIDPAKPDSIGSRSFQCYGLLKRGVTIGAARAEMAVVASTLASEYPLDKGFGVFVAGLHDYLVSDRRLPLLLLMAVVAAVLLIACANLASLLLARGLGRRGELALRTALGARRERIVRQLVTESLVLSSLGGLAGLALAYAATRALLALSAGALGIGTIELIRLDSTCLIFTIALSTLTALLFGLVPAWQASRVDPQLALREWTRGSRADRRHQRVRSGLVVSEIGLAVVLLISAGLLLRTFSSLVRVNLGFQPASTITMNVFLGARPAEERIALVDEIIDRVEAVPGVKVASTVQFLPLTGLNCGTGFWRDGQVPGDASSELPTECSLVSRGYFAAMGIPVLEGRAFGRQDRMTSPRVVMVNHAFAARYFPEGHVTGRRILVHGSNQAPAEVVGVVGDIRHDGLTMEPAPTVFLLHSQTPGYITNLVVRTTGNPVAQAAAVRRAIQEVDRNQAVSAVKTMDEYLGESLARPRLYAALVATFAALAVILAAVGIYGLLAYAVNQQRHEIGIRFALGATRGNVFRSVFGNGVLLTFGGITAGIFAALGVRGVLSTLLFGVTPVDPTTYAIAAGVFTSIALAAAAIPAHRASRVPPVTALKCE
jgi:putative ABC transport system permease protein